MFEKVLERLAVSFKNAGIPLNSRYIERWLKEFDRTFPGKKFLSSYEKLKRVK